MQNEEIRYLDEKSKIPYIDKELRIPYTIWWDEEKKSVKLIDQKLLPHKIEAIECVDWECMGDAIKDLSIRGAPALGAAGAYALVVEAFRYEGDEEGFFKKMNKTKDDIEVRPTARNLMWAAERVYNKLVENRGKDIQTLRNIALEEAGKIVKEDIYGNRNIGIHGLEIFRKFSNWKEKEFRILTHCHAGSLATCGYGTVFGVFRAAIEEGIKLRVFADETRPLLQGARITVWELNREGIPLTLITDNSAGWIMKEEGIDMVIVGADRIAANGDTANKIGTYSLSILAKEHKIPFYVAAPTSTIDMEITCGEEIKIEKRGHKEVIEFQGSNVNPYLEEDQVLNCAFDVTPHGNIDGIITEKGIIRDPDKLKVGKLFDTKKS